MRLIRRAGVVVSVAACGVGMWPGSAGAASAVRPSMSAVWAASAGAESGTSEAAGAPATSAPAPNPAGVAELQSGYWWESQPGGAPLPPPPQVPQNGLWVSSDPSGTQSMSAVRFTLGFGMSLPVLTLSVNQAQPAQQLSVVACPVATASAQWKPPGTAGAWSSRPMADCGTGSVAGQLSSDGKTMRFDLSRLYTADVSAIDIVIQPAAIPNPASVVPGTPAATSPTFDLTFDQVTPSDVAATVAASGADTSTSDNVPATPSLDQSAVNSASVPLPVASAPEFTDTSGAISAPASSSASVAPPAAPQTSSGTPQIALALTAGAHGSSSKTPTTRQRWILLSLLVDLALFAAWEERRRLSGAGHVRLSLYEIPTVASREAARQLERDGAPPPLR